MGPDKYIYYTFIKYNCILCEFGTVMRALACDIRAPYDIVIYECFIHLILSEFSTANTDVYIFFGIFPVWINIWTAMDTRSYKCWCTDAWIVYLYNVQSWRECDRRERKERIYLGAKSMIEREREIRAKGT